MWSYYSIVRHSSPTRFPSVSIVFILSLCYTALEVIETRGQRMKPITKNTLFYGDNLPILRQYIYDEISKAIEMEEE